MEIAAQRSSENTSRLSNDSEVPCLRSTSPSISFRSVFHPVQRQPGAIHKRQYGRIFAEWQFPLRRDFIWLYCGFAGGAPCTSNEYAGERATAVSNSATRCIYFTYFRRTAYSRLVIFITNHSHDITGDLYIGPNVSAPVKYVSLPISFLMNSTNVLQFMNALFPSALKRYVRSIPCTMFLLCCGAVVRESVSFSELTGFVQSWACLNFFWWTYLIEADSVSVNDLVAFSAPEFHAGLTVGFFVDYAQRVLIEGFSLRPSFKQILTATSQSALGRHTNIVHVHRDAETSAFLAWAYVFTHVQWRPWGNRLPIACPECQSPQAWAQAGKQGSTYLYACRWKGCKGKCAFRKPEGYELYSQDVNGGRWMQKTICL